MTGQFMAGMPGIPAGMIGGPMTNQAGQYTIPPNVPGVYLGGQSTTTVANPAVRAQSTAAINSGVDNAVRRLQQGVQRNMKVLQQDAVAGVKAANQAVGNNALFPRGAMFSGALTPVLQGAGEISEGEIGQGTGRMVGGTAGAVGTGALVKKLMGEAGKRNPLLGLGGIAIGSVFGGNVAGAVSAAAGGFVEDKVGGVTGRGDSRGAQRKRSEQDTEVAARNIERLTQASMNPAVQANIQLSEAFMNQRLTELQKSMPMINEFQNQQLVRQQALNASQAQNYMAMGTVATAGKLATGAQEQAGATLRTAITSNPYASNVLQAPNINFG